MYLNVKFSQQKIHIYTTCKTVTLHCLSAQIPTTYSVPVFEIQVMRQMFNLLRTVTYNYHAQNKYCEVSWLTTSIVCHWPLKAADTEQQMKISVAKPDWRVLKTFPMLTFRKQT